jgi:hypothetical protein
MTEFTVLDDVSVEQTGNMSKAMSWARNISKVSTTGYGLIFEPRTPRYLAVARLLCSHQHRAVMLYDLVIGVRSRNRRQTWVRCWWTKWH